jgi:hypothetical protein
MPDRRTFLITCAGALAAPALSLPLFGATSTPIAPATAMAATTEAPVLRIDGWDGAADSGNDVWLQINSSWRAAWR